MVFTQYLTYADIAAIIFILLGAIQGLFRRLSGEMARLLGAICAFAAGGLLHEPLGLWVTNHTRLVEHQARIFTYILTVVASIVLWAIFHKLIKNALRALLPQGFDRAAGIPAGMLRTAAITGIIFITMNIIPNAPFQDQFGENSFFGRLALRLVPTVKEKLEEHQIPSIPPHKPEDEPPETQQQDSPYDDA